MKAIALRPRMKPRWGVGPQIVVVVLVIGLFASLAVEPTRQLIEQRARIAGMAEDLDRVQRSNERLSDRVARLKDPDFLEQRARTQMGLVRPGETTFIVMPPSRGGGAKKRERQDRPKAPEPPTFFEAFVTFIGLP